MCILQEKHVSLNEAIQASFGVRVRVLVCVCVCVSVCVCVCERDYHLTFIWHTFMSNFTT